MRNVRPTRFAVLAALAILAVVVAVVAGSATAKTSGITLTISNWDAYTPKDLIPNFEKATGIKVKLAKHTTNEDIMGKLEAQNGGGYDIVFVSLRSAAAFFSCAGLTVLIE